MALDLGVGKYVLSRMFAKTFHCNFNKYVNGVRSVSYTHLVLSVPASAKENSDNVIRVGSFEETYNVVNEKGERSGYGYEYLQDIAGYAGWTYKSVS